ncbi:DUF6941 family protein [Burkholderia vietnamiensis]|uniref:DUF6941 family protein n=1 Tax=Burkholderia vietnamiensis TaxID=60552 RepID=UPI001594AD5B|nr:hypothetical protein [Burkholderia vietnamiensis]
MKATFSAIADTVIRDADRNSLTLFDLLDGIELSVFPVALPRLSACFVVEREEGDADIEAATMRLKSGAVNNSFPISVEFHGKRRTRVIARVEGYVVFQPGIITAELEKDGTVIGSYSFEVTASLTPQAPAIVAQ